MTMLLAHIAFCTPYVITSVYPKVRSLDPNLANAAMDLGATPFQALTKVIIPMLKPGIFAGMLLAFTMSLDDFVVSYFVTGNGVSNISFVVYNSTQRTKPTINALPTANSVLVSIQCEYYALEGLSQLIHTIDLIKERLNPKLEIEGVVFTMYDARTNLSLQVVENVKENLDKNIYKTIIPRNVRLAEAPSYGMPIYMYDSRSAGAEAYRYLAEELIEKEDENEWL